MRIPLLILLVTGSSLLGQDPFSEVEPTKDDTFKIFPDPNGKAYFPKGRESYYTKYLAAMIEPSVVAPLTNGVQKVFRLTYLRSFHDPLVVRLTMRDGIFEMRAVQLERDREWRPVKIIHDETKKLNQEDSAALAQMLEKEDFWKEFTDGETLVMEMIRDGSTWIFEMHDANGYKMVEVRSPQHLADIAKDGEIEVERDFSQYFHVGARLLKLGDISPPKDEHY